MEGAKLQLQARIASTRNSGRSYLFIFLILVLSFMLLLNSLWYICSPKLKEHMQYCVDHPDEVNQLAKVQSQVSEVKGVMIENIEKVEWKINHHFGYQPKALCPCCLFMLSFILLWFRSSLGSWQRGEDRIACWQNWGSQVTGWFDWSWVLCSMIQLQAICIVEVFPWEFLIKSWKRFSFEAVLTP